MSGGGKKHRTTTEEFADEDDYNDDDDDDNADYEPDELNNILEEMESENGDVEEDPDEVGDRYVQTQYVLII